MPLKWKIYYWLTWYHLVFNITAIIFIVHLFFISGNTTNGSMGAIGLVIVCVMALTIFKPLVSFQFIKHLEDKTVFTETELNLFTVAFVLNIIIMLFAGYALVLEIAYMPGDGVSAGDIVAILSTTLFVFTCFYLLFNDSALKSLIRKQRFNKTGAKGNNIRKTP